MQALPDTFPCPINSTTTTCTLFAATDSSWEALATFVGIGISTFEQLPVVNPVRSASSIHRAFMHRPEHVGILTLSQPDSNQRSEPDLPYEDAQC